MSVELVCTTKLRKPVTFRIEQNCSGLLFWPPSSVRSNSMAVVIAGLLLDRQDVQVYTNFVQRPHFHFSTFNFWVPLGLIKYSQELLYGHGLENQLQINSSRRSGSCDWAEIRMTELN
jgi:hypothetical protein